MFKNNSFYLSLGKHLLYKSLSKDILYHVNKLIDWKPKRIRAFHLPDNS